MIGNATGMINILTVIIMFSDFELSWSLFLILQICKNAIRLLFNSNAHNQRPLKIEFTAL